jgi:arylsulfatase A-like enzyme
MTTKANSVLLITIDSLRQDFVSCYSDSPVTTPCIDTLADTGIRFEEAISTASHTKDSFPGILTSSLPSEQGRHHISPDNISVAEAFQQDGYETAGFHSTPMMSSSNNYDMGFGTFVDMAGDDTHTGISSIKSHFPKPLLSIADQIVERFNIVGYADEVSLTVNAADLTERVLEYLTKSTSPQFLFVHYMDVHTPYTPPKEYIQEYVSKDLSDRKIQEINNSLLANKNSVRGNPDLVQQEELDLAKDLYRGAIRFVDNQIKEIVDTLKEQRKWKNTLIIVTSDHGEEFGEHGGFFHGQKLYEELLRVPLIISGGVVENHTIKNQVSLLDLAPTILDLSNIDIPETMSGKSLSEIAQGGQPTTKYALSETTVKKLGEDIGRTISCRSSNNKKLIYNEDDPEWTKSEFEFYDLNTDPNETQNLFNHIHHDQIQDLRKHIDELANGRIAQDEMEDAAEERLKSLGYLE